MRRLLENELSRIGQILERLGPSPALLDSELVRDLLCATDFVSRTIHVFVRDDLSQDAWDVLSPSEQALIEGTFIELGYAAENVGLDSMVERPEYFFRSEGKILALARISGFAQYTATCSVPSFVRQASAKHTARLAVAALGCLLAMSPWFEMAQIDENRVKYYQGNLRAGLNQMDQYLWST